MPETAVDEQGDVEPGKYDIGPPRQIAAMEPEAVAHFVKKPTNDKLGAGILPLDRPHVAGALLAGQYVGHGSRHDRLRIVQEVRNVVNLKFPIRRILLVKSLGDDQGDSCLPHLFHLIGRDAGLKREDVPML